MYFNHADYDGGSNLVFDVEPDFGTTTNAIYGNDVQESYGGKEYSDDRWAGSKKNTWSFSLSNISSTFKDELETFRDTVLGSHKTFTYNDGSTSHTVRMSDDSLSFSEVSYQRYSTSVNLRKQI